MSSAGVSAEELRAKELLVLGNSDDELQLLDALGKSDWDVDKHIEQCQAEEMVMLAREDADVEQDAIVSPLLTKMTTEEENEHWFQSALELHIWESMATAIISIGDYIEDNKQFLDDFPAETHKKMWLSDPRTKLDPKGELPVEFAFDYTYEPPFADAAVQHELRNSKKARAMVEPFPDFAVEKTVAMKSRARNHFEWKEAVLSAKGGATPLSRYSSIYDGYKLRLQQVMATGDFRMKFPTDFFEDVGQYPLGFPQTESDMETLQKISEIASSRRKAPGVVSGFADPSVAIGVDAATGLPRHWTAEMGDLLPGVHPLADLHRFKSAMVERHKWDTVRNESVESVRVDYFRIPREYKDLIRFSPDGRCFVHFSFLDKYMRKGTIAHDELGSTLPRSKPLTDGCVVYSADTAEALSSEFGRLAPVYDLDLARSYEHKFLRLESLTREWCRLTPTIWEQMTFRERARAKVQLFKQNQVLLRWSRSRAAAVFYPTAQDLRADPSAGQRLRNRLFYLATSATLYRDVVLQNDYAPFRASDKEEIWKKFDDSDLGEIPRSESSERMILSALKQAFRGGKRLGGRVSTRSSDATKAVVVLFPRRKCGLRSGMWSRSAALFANLRLGSSVTYAEQCVARGWTCVMLNPNDNMIATGSGKSLEDCRVQQTAPFHRTTEEHALNVFDDLILPLAHEPRDVLFVAHGDGCADVMHVIENRPRSVRKFLKGIAFVDSYDVDVSKLDFLKGQTAFWCSEPGLLANPTGVLKNFDLGDGHLYYFTKNAEERYAPHVNYVQVFRHLEECCAEQRDSDAEDDFDEKKLFEDDEDSDDDEDEDVAAVRRVHGAKKRLQYDSDQDSLSDSSSDSPPPRRRSIQMFPVKVGDV